MQNMLNRVHWWSIVLDDAAQLTDALNQADQEGFEIETILPHKEGIILVVKAFITTANVSLLRKGFNRAAKEETAKKVPASGQSVHAPAPLAAAVGKATERQHRNRGPKDKTRDGVDGHTLSGQGSGIPPATRIQADEIQRGHHGVRDR